MRTIVDQFNVFHSQKTDNVPPLVNTDSSASTQHPCSTLNYKSIRQHTLSYSKLQFI